MSGVLSKTTSVMDIDYCGVFITTFAQREEETDQVARYVELSSDTWSDLGKPSQITISIEPGDRLNGVTA